MSNTLLDVLIEAVKDGGKAAMSVVPNSGVISKEGRANFVTAGDLASEKAVLEVIKSNFTEDVVLSEETESEFGREELLSLDRLWVVDPIDGTNNFRNQRYYSCVSLGYVEKGVVKAGAVYDFYHDELFHAEKGKGAFLNGKLISVGEQEDLYQGTISTDNSYVSEETRNNLELLMKIDPVPFVLMKGSAALMLCDVAAGRTDLYFHTVLKPWDVAAGFLIVEEAGGVMRGLNGEDINFLSPTVVAGNERLVGQFVEKVRG